MRETPGTDTAREVGLLLATIPALLDAAVRLAHPVERLTLPEGRIVVTVGGRPRSFRSPADALAVAERCADDLRMLCLRAGHGAAGGALAALLGRFRPFTLESCDAVKAGLATVRALAALGRAEGAAA
ncbi:MAG TPA: hypothetical protein VH877_29065 [Polyangia bacterium]|jgi:hypothetical protein|nr:hypothetical protein [Polyangia bacterium]